MGPCTGNCKAIDVGCIAQFHPNETLGGCTISTVGFATLINDHCHSFREVTILTGKGSLSQSYKHI